MNDSSSKINLGSTYAFLKHMHTAIQASDSGRNASARAIHKGRIQQHVQSTHQVNGRDIQWGKQVRVLKDQRLVKFKYGVTAKSYDDRTAKITTDKESQLGRKRGMAKLKGALKSHLTPEGRALRKEGFSSQSAKNLYDAIKLEAGGDLADRIKDKGHFKEPLTYGKFKEIIGMVKYEYEQAKARNASSEGLVVAEGESYSSHKPESRAGYVPNQVNPHKKGTATSGIKPSEKRGELMSNEPPMEIGLHRQGQAKEVLVPGSHNLDTLTDDVIIEYPSVESNADLRGRLLEAAKDMSDGMKALAKDLQSGVLKADLLEAAKIMARAQQGMIDTFKNPTQGLSALDVFNAAVAEIDMQALTEKSQRLNEELKALQQPPVTSEKLQQAKSKVAELVRLHQQFIQKAGG